MVILDINYRFLDKYVSNQSSSIRRINNAPVILKANEIKTFLEKFAPRIKVVVLDLDGTIVDELSNSIDDRIIEQIIELTKAGIHIAIVSGTYVERIQRLLFDKFPADFKNHEFIHIYACAGTRAYSLGVDNKINTNVPYYEYAFTDEQQHIIDEVIEAFKERYSSDFESVSDEGSKRGIYLRRDRKYTPEIVEEYVRFLKTELEKEGAPEIIVNAGGTNWTVDILFANKSIAINDLAWRITGVTAENIMVVADSFSGSSGNDRAMIAPGVLVFNVGRHEDIPRGIYSLEVKGPRGASELLSILLELRSQSLKVSPIEITVKRKNTPNGKRPSN